MTTSGLAARVAQALRERGLNPDNAPPFDPRIETVDERVERVTAALDRRIHVRYRAARVTHPPIVAWAKRTADGATEPLFIAGTTGTGKTWQAFGAIRALATHAAKHGRTLNWDYVTHPVLAAAARPHPDQSHVTALDPYLSLNLLVVDDIGATKSTDWTADTLYQLVDHRDHHCLPTIWITNLDPRALHEALSDRIESRLLAAETVTMTGPDRRGGSR